MRLKMLAAVAGLMMTSSAAQAAVLVTISENAAGVNVVQSGYLDLSGLTYVSTGSRTGGIDPSQGFFSTSITNGAVYSGLRGIPRTGTGGFSPITSQSGGQFGFNIATGQFYVPASYVSNTEFGSAFMIAGATFASLGLRPGDTYYSYGRGAAFDSLAISVVATPTPEPASWAMMILGIGAIGVAARRTRARVRVAA